MLIVDTVSLVPPFKTRPSFLRGQWYWLPGTSQLYPYLEVAFGWQELPHLRLCPLPRGRQHLMPDWVEYKSLGHSFQCRMFLKSYLSLRAFERISWGLYNNCITGQLFPLSNHASLTRFCRGYPPINFLHSCPFLDSVCQELSLGQCLCCVFHLPSQINLCSLPSSATGGSTLKPASLGQPCLLVSCYLQLLVGTGKKSEGRRRMGHAYLTPILFSEWF